MKKFDMNGFTILELLIALVIVGIIASVAIPMYSDYVEELRVTEAITEIKEIEVQLQRFYSETGRYPDDLTQINLDSRLAFDPWDSAYQFLNIENSTKKGKGGLRKDKNLNPLNSDYDLYSMGKDQNSKGPLTAKPSHDDIVRARNGGFVGLATEF